MKDYTVEQMITEWRRELTPLHCDLQIAGAKEEEFLEITDRKTSKKMTVSVKKFEGKVKELGLPKVIEMYTCFVQDWQAVITQPILLEVHRVFPCIRPKSILNHPSASKLQTYPHTAETVIVLALDQDKGYKLLTQSDLERTELSAEMWLEQAVDNLRKLPYSFKKQTVADNDFYFFHQNDGYDASRILLEDIWLKEIPGCKSELTFSIPHQDVLIAAKCNNENGLEILARMTMEFYSEGRSPITSFSFHYPDEKSALEPIFIFLK